MQSAWWNYPRVCTARSTVKGISVQCSCGTCQSRSRYGIKKDVGGADVDWYVKAEDIVLKNKGNQNAGSPQNPTTQGQPKK